MQRWPRMVRTPANSTYQRQQPIIVVGLMGIHRSDFEICLPHAMRPAYGSLEREYWTVRESPGSPSPDTILRLAHSWSRCVEESPITCTPPIAKL